MKTIFAVFVLLLSFSTVIYSHQAADQNTCPPPSNIAVTSQTANSVSFDWDDCGCAVAAYRVYFEKGGLNSPEYSVINSDISFSGLPSGSYRFYFYTVCGGAVSSIIIDEIILN